MKNLDADVEIHLMFNMYKIFELQENKFEIDMHSLEKKYIELQKKYHPDNAKIDSDKLGFLRMSADINTSFSILKDDYSRAVYILKNNNIDILSDEYRHHLDQEFMVEILEKSELLETLKDSEGLLNFLEKLKNERAETVGKISKIINNDLKTAALETIKLKYFDNLIEKTNHILEKCF
jgi:molecular chaperone HscB